MELTPFTPGERRLEDPDVSQEPTSILLELQSSIEALAIPEQTLRSEYRSLPREAELETSINATKASELVNRNARFLELFLAVSGFLEAIHEVGIRSDEELKREFDRVCTIGKVLTGLDAREVVASSSDVIGAIGHEERPRLPYEDLLERLVREVRSLLAICPIDALERLAAFVGLEPLGHRCRQAYEGLSALVLRNSVGRDKRLKIAGRAYAEGRLSLAEAASMLGLNTSDAIAAFEQNGFRRSLEAIQLTDDERRGALTRIREDRLRRDGRPDPSPSLIARDVIASQRIEGVDARPWLPHTT